jgi:hypothetical protein
MPPRRKRPVSDRATLQPSGGGWTALRTTLTDSRSRADGADPRIAVAAALGLAAEDIQVREART